MSVSVIRLEYPIPGFVRGKVLSILQTIVCYFCEIFRYLEYVALFIDWFQSNGSPPNVIYYTEAIFKPRVETNNE